MINAYIDGDWILYAAGFAGQREKCVYINEQRVIFGDNMTEIKKQLTDEETYDGTKLYKRQQLDPETHFYHTAKQMIERNCDKVAQKFNEEVKPIVIIDGDGNYRTRIATVRPYKGTRNVHAKPLMFNNIRGYLLDVWGAEVVFDQEADDEMAIRQTADRANGQKSIVVGVDKDLLQVPGWHLNPNKGFMKVSPQQGLHRLYVQCVQGDPVDNIAGAYKCGPVAAQKAILIEMTELEMWNAAVDVYEESIEKHGNQYGGKSGLDAAIENMRLVYLRRQPGETWLGPQGS